MSGYFDHLTLDISRALVRCVCSFPATVAFCPAKQKERMPSGVNTQMDRAY